MVKKEIVRKEINNYESLEEIQPPETRIKSRMSSKRESRCKSELGSRKGEKSSRKNLKSANKLDFPSL